MTITKANDNLKRGETNIFVFRTNINCKSAFLNLTRELEKLNGLHDCSIDLEDCDNVLRVECKYIPPERIIKIVEENGFFCEELTW